MTIKLGKENFNDIYQDFCIQLPEEILPAFSTESVTALSVFLAKPTNQASGTLYGIAKVKRPIVIKGHLTEEEPFSAETSLIRFVYTVYNPPLVTNNMQNICPYFLPQYDDNIEDPTEYLNHLREQDRIRSKLEAFPWGPKGFWLHTSTKTLEGDDLECRLLIRKVQSASRKLNLPALVKKMNKQPVKHRQVFDSHFESIKDSCRKIQGVYDLRSTDMDSSRTFTMVETKRL